MIRACCRNPREIEEAAALLNAGELVAFPTETVYGLGADASNPRAVARIFAAKGRPTSHPLIVHVSNFNAARAFASEVPDSGGAARGSVLARSADARAAEVRARAALR